MRSFKKSCAVMLALLMICASAAPFSAAETYITLYGFAFDINSDGTAVIHSYDNRQPSMDIPNSLMGYPVGTIDEFAFFNNTGITSVSFEKTTQLKRIGSNAFCGCAGLSELTVPASVTELGFGAFQNCIGLHTLLIEDGLVEIPEQAFFGCAGLEKVTLPNSVTAIADNAFEGCDSIVIYCFRGSYADDYAQQNRIPLRYLDVFSVIRGDADGDETVSIFDATVIQRCLNQIVVSCFVESAADADGDGRVTILDVTAIQRSLVQLPTNENIGKPIT